MDSGVTLNYLIHILEQRRPKSIHIAALLDKRPALRPVHVSYVGFKIPDEFVVGFGLDYGKVSQSERYLRAGRQHRGQVERWKSVI